jgi:RHS repeat-associated protein
MGMPAKAAGSSAQYTVLSTQFAAGSTQHSAISPRPASRTIHSAQADSRPIPIKASWREFSTSDLAAQSSYGSHFFARPEVFGSLGALPSVNSLPEPKRETATIADLRLGLPGLLPATAAALPQENGETGLNTESLSASSTPNVSSIVSNFNGTSIAAGNYIWFNAVIKPSGIGSSPVRIFLRNQTVRFSANGVSYNLSVPDSTITFSSSNTTSTVKINTLANEWLVNTKSGLSGNYFMAGLPFPVPAGGLPGGINPVTWTGTFYTDTSGVTLNWQWAAAVYTKFSSNLGSLGVKPIDASSGSPYNNSDHAGTPESFKTSVTGGARGGGGSNYTGSYSGTACVTPAVQVPNYPPVANAGPNQTAFVGNTVQLDGSGSFDADGDPLTYHWSLVSVPAGSTATLSNPTSVKPTFAVDKAGNYVAQLIVNDGKVNSTPASVTISTQNSPPVANAGPNQTVTTHTTVQLDGSKSSDVDGDPLTYAWTITGKPAGSAAILSNATLVNPTFVVDVKGTYTIQLIVNDGHVNSAPATVTISDVNSPPVANAGPNQTIIANHTVQLDGSGSTDVDGDALTYRWAILSTPAGSTASLSNATAVKPSFFADLIGDYVVQLIVNDGTVDSTPSTVTITTNDVPPVANAGPAQTVALGSLVTLDGSASTDVDGKSLTYQWSLIGKPTGSAATLATPTAVNPYFTVDKAGNYVAQLIVNDGFLNSQPSTVTISTLNSKPVANAGPAQTVTAGSTVQLDGSGSSDADEDPLTYSWAILSQPTGGTAALSNAATVNPTFVASLAGTYVVQLIVNDGKVNSDPATTTITAKPQNQPPVVDAGPDQTITLPTNTVMLNGTATDDGLPNGTLIIQWSEISGPASVTFSSPNTAVTQATFSAAGTYVLQLSANDSQYTSTSTTTVTVLPAKVNQPPVVNAGPNQTITLPANTVTLNGTASDPQNSPMTFAWIQVSGPGIATFSNPTALTTTASFTIQGTYTLQLTATDALNLSGSATVHVTVNPSAQNQPPVVNAGPSQAITLPTNTVTLNGTATDDGLPNGTLLIHWSQVSGPTSVTFGTPNQAVTQASFNDAGIYILRLTANDTQLSSSSDVTVFVYPNNGGKNQPPYVNAGPDQNIVLPAAAQLNGIATDDGLPNGTLLISWSKLSGPGDVTFSSPTAASTTASFSIAGTYVLRLAANDSLLVSTSDVTVVVGKLDGHRSNQGTDFWLMFPANYDGGPPVGGNPPQLVPQLLISSDAQTSGTVSIPGMQFSQDFSVTPGQVTTVTLPYNVDVLTADIVENKGIHVTSQKPVAINGLSYYQFTSDGYLGLPTPVLGTSYYVMDYPKVFWPGEFGIVAAYDGTTVTITPTASTHGRTSGQPYTVVLNQGRTYQMMNDNAFPDDLAGTLINSDKPIAVFGGNRCANLPASLVALFRFCNHIVEELPPTELWGEDFVTIPLATRQKGDTFRILASEDNTNITITGQASITLARAQYYETILLNASEIHSDKPILVTQFENSLEWDHPNFLDQGNTGDPSMILIPPYDQFGGHYTVATPASGFPVNFANVIAPTSAVGSIQMDGQPIPAASFSPIASSVFSGAQVPVSIGTHNFTGTAPFGVYLYGFFTADSYGYQGGMVLNSAKAGTQITLTPKTYTQLTGTQACVTASVTDPAGSPLGGIGVAFSVAGANPSVNPPSKSVDTDVNGQAQYCYTGANSGSDIVHAGIGVASDSGTITWNPNAANQAPFVSAGPNQTVTLPGAANLTGVVGDDGLPQGSTLAVTWSQVSGPGTVAFGNANAAVTFAAFSAAGTYDLRLTANDSQLSSSSDVIVTVNPAPPANQAPVVNAGPNQTTTLPINSVTLAGTATDDGLPAAAKLAVQWTEVSGPANSTPVTFSNSTGVNTNAIFVEAGTYVLRLTADDSQLSSSSDVTITVIALNKAPQISTTENLTLTLPANSLPLTATVTDDGLPAGSTVTVQWSMISGPAPVVFSTPTQPNTQATFTASGLYSLQLTANDTQLSSTFPVFVTVNPANKPPVISVNTGFLQITLPVNTATLDATVTDDGLPNGTLNIAWALGTGPAPVTFSTPNQATTQVTFTAPGTYSFTVTADDSQLQTQAFAEVQVLPGNQAPVVSAGPNLSTTLPNATVTLQGTVTDDGLPAGAPVTQQWSQVSGPGVVTFSTPTQPVTQATFPAAGTYVLQLTASDTQLTGSATATVTVFPAPQNLPPVVSAGPSRTTVAGSYTFLAGSVTDDGLPVGGTLTSLWTQISGPAAATIQSPTSAGTYVIFSQTGAGVYVFRLTANDSQLSSSADVNVTVTPIPNQPPQVFPGGYSTTMANPTITLQGAVSDDGLPNGTLIVQWSQVSGPAPVIFANSNQAVTQATFQASGVYQLRLSANDTQYTTTRDAIVQVAPLNQPPQISLTVSPGTTITLPANTVTLNGVVTDDGLPNGTLTSVWSEEFGPGPVVFSAPNQPVTQASFSVSGFYRLWLTASDSQLTTAARVDITVLAPPPAPPQVSIQTPTDGTQITKPLDVIATVISPSAAWKLEYSLNTDDGSANQHWMSLNNTFVGGSSQLKAQKAGTIDPTVMQNGTYTLRLTATDNYGQASVAKTSFMVSKNMKVGDFTLSFNDLSVPLPGLPITIVRTYDSRNQDIGDFGLGWTLNVANVRLQKNRPLGPNWDEEFTVSNGITQYCLQPANDRTVTVTFPDNKQYIFQAQSGPPCQNFVPITAPTVTFVEQPGSSPGTAGATLVPADGGQVLFDAAVPGVGDLSDYNGNTYNPTVFILTTAEGYSYTIDQKLGVTSLVDPNGNSLTINATGITSSSGKNVAFTRDAKNRITQITDPNGNVLKYQYDDLGSGGSLVAFTDATNNRSTYDYQFVAGTFLMLVLIIDPRGILPVRNSYDNAGHLISTTDAFGKTIKFDHHIDGQFEIVTDRLGNQTTYTYDTDGNITSIIDALNNTTTFTFDGFDNKISEQHPLHQNPTTYTYDGLGNATSITDPLGNVSQSTYNAHKQALTLTDALGNTTTNTYDINTGNLLTSLDAQNHLVQNVYVPHVGLLQTTSLDGGQRAALVYDNSGNLTDLTDALGNHTTYTYDNNNNRLTQSATRTKADGAQETLTTKYDYDAANRIIKTTNPDGTFTQVHYNSIGKQDVTTDALGRQTRYDYDDAGRLTKTTYPDLTFEASGYDDEGHRISSTDRAGHTTTYQYDALGRLVKTFGPGNVLLSTTNYDAAGRVASTVDALGNQTSYGYDDADRRVSVTDALGKVTQFFYDSAGNRTSVKDVRGNTTQFVYDKLERKVKTIYPDAGQGQTFDLTTYDSLGRLSQKQDQAGRITQYGYDASSRLTSVTQSNNGVNLVTTYGYDELGNRVSQTDANGHTTKYEYDQLGRRSKRTLPAGQFETYTYDADGNLKTKTDFNGKTTTYAYDAVNRLLSKTPDGSFNAAPISYTYFPNGLRQSMTDPSGTTNYTYDNRNRLLSKATPFGTLSYTYDAANLLTITSSNLNGAAMTYSYDTLNRLSTVQDASGTTTYNYDPVGNLASFVYPNGVQHSYTYDTQNRLTQMGSSCGTAVPGCVGGTQLSSYTYTLGAAGNRLSVAELSGRNVSYGYDNLYRLTSESITCAVATPNCTTQQGSIGYAYDNVGNRLNMTSSVPAIPPGPFSFDADDRLTTDNYDPDGNTISSGGILNSYDFESHLIKHGSVTIVYDGDGNRVAETVGGITTNYLVDTNNPTGYAQVVDELQNNSVTRTYSYGLERIYERQLVAGNWQLSFYGYDGHGSVRQLFSSTGTITDSYTYDAFGNLIESTGTTPNNYLFAGEQFDPALGLYFLRARYYNTNTGRFWSMDSFEGDPESPASLHKYLYAGADPTNHIDPSGHDFDIVSTLSASTGYATIFGLSTFQSALIINGVLGGLLAASSAGFGAALEGQTPDQIQDATGSLFNIALGTLIGMGGGLVGAYRIGRLILAIVALGGGGWQARKEYENGKTGAALYYGLVGLLAAGLVFLVPSLLKVPDPLIINVGGEGEVPGVVNVNTPWILDPNFRSAGGSFTLTELQVQGAQFVIYQPGSPLPYGTGTVDQVITNGVPIDLDYLGQPGINSAEIWRVLKPNGIWLNNEVPQTRP